MAVEPALKKDTGIDHDGKDHVKLPQEYDRALHERALRWMSYTRSSSERVARRLGRGRAAVEAYMKGEYKGNLPELEKQIAIVLLHEEDTILSVPKHFCETQSANVIWEVLQFSHEEGSMGLAVGPSGSGKSETANAYRESHYDQVILVTASIVTRRVGNVLRLISGNNYMMDSTSLSIILEMLADEFRRRKKLIIIDDAHFLTWECFEAVRTLHDRSGVGVACLGQERLYDSMKGRTNHAYLYDQIYSRIGIKRDRLPIERQDVRMVADSLFPGLDKKCIDFLYSKAQGKGRFRAVTKILRLAVKRNEGFGDPVDIDLLMEASRFLMI